MKEKKKKLTLTFFFIAKERNILESILKKENNEIGFITYFSFYSVIFSCILAET